MKPYFVRALPLVALSALAFTANVCAQDTDGDFLSDAEESIIGTSPYNNDTDGDGLTDRAEVFPYSIVTGAFTFDEAMADAKAKGGWLAIIDSPQKLYAVKRGIQSAALGGALPTPLPNNYDPSINLPSTLWIGASDKLIPGEFQWVKPSAQGSDLLNGVNVGSAGFGDLTPLSNIVTNVVDINAFTVGQPFVATGVLQGTTITAINTTARTLTLSNPVDAFLSQRIAQIVVSNGGFGYTTAPNISFSGGTNALSSVRVTTPGSGYTSAPAVTFTGGGGSGATAVATIDGTGAVTGLTITTRGSAYTSAPTVAFAPAFPITSAVTVTAQGIGYTAAPRVSFTGGGGTGASATATVTGGKVTGVTITNVGRDYSSAPTIVFTPTSGGSGAVATATLGGTAAVATSSLGGPPTAVATLTADGRVKSITVTALNDAFYTAAPTVTITDGNGGGAAASAVLTVSSTAYVTGIAKVNGGSGYNPSNVTATLTGGGGTGATATVSLSSGVVTGVAVVNPGTGYVSPPAVTIASGVNSIGVTTAGVGYTSAPTVAISAPNVSGGTQATATASISGGVVTGYTITNAGSGYTTTPTVTLTGGGFTTAATATASVGLGATATASIRQLGGRIQSPVPNTYVNWAGNFPLARANSREGIYLNTGTGFTWSTSQVSAEVSSVTVTGGSGYTTPPKLTIVGGGGTGATAEATVKIDGTISANIVNSGEGYTTPPSVLVDGGIGLANSGIIKTITVGGAGAPADGSAGKYATITVNPTVTILGGGGSGATATASLTPYYSSGDLLFYYIGSVNVTNGGSGYTSPPVITFSGGDGGGARAVADTNYVNASITNGGSGYTSPPTVTIAAPGSTIPGAYAATATAILTNGVVTGLNITNSGYGYTAVPAVTFSGGGGTGATATAVLGFPRSLSPIQLTNSGFGYTSRPTVTITGGGGSGASAYANISPEGSLTSITVTNPGTNYITCPTVTITGGGGSGATARSYIGDAATAVATINIAEKDTNRGYILERPITDPLLADTDSDGIDDLTELVSGSTSPLLADTDGDGIDDSAKGWVGSTLDLAPGAVIPYANTLVRGDYEGLVMDSTNGVSFKQTLRLTNKGSFSSKLLGLAANASLSGAFTSAGNFSGNSKLGAVTMSFAKQADNTYYINGSFGGTYTFELRPVRSAGAVRKLTFEASPTEAVDLDSPDYSGSAVATGTVAKNGVVSFKVYLPDGSTGSYSGPVVDGNYIMLYVRSSSKTTLVGSVLVRTLTGESDFDGTVKWSGYGDVTGQMRKLTGSNYVSPTLGKLGLTSFGAVNNLYNSVYNWVDGDFEGVAKAGAWASSGTITVPCTQIDAMKTSFDNATGLVPVSYTRTDSSRALINSVAKGYAVALQSNQTLKGFYTSAKSGAFNIQPNTGNVLPDLMGITPMSKSASAAETDYTVQVFTSGIWTASVPSTATWVTISNPLDMRYVTSLTPPNTVTTGIGLDGTVTLTPVAADSDGDYLTDITETTITLTNPKLADTDGDGISDGAEYLLFNTNPLVFDGRDYGTVHIKLAKNITGQRRTAVITIAGKQHTIVQDFR
jgi:hypothetical protein